MSVGHDEVNGETAFLTQMLRLIIFKSDEQPARRSERPRSRTRSRSPTRNRTSLARTRSPIRSPPPKPADPKSAPPSTLPKPAPPTGPRAQKPQQPTTAASKAPSSAPTNGISSETTGPSVAVSKTPGKPKPGTSAKEKEQEMDVDEDPEIALMRQMMGFAGFRSTKQTKVPGNNVYEVRKEKKTEYRQYMNRVGGFNRPLSPSR